MAVIREDLLSIGVKRKVPKGPYPIHNPHPHPHPLLKPRQHLIGVDRKDQFSIGVKRKIPSGPDPIHNPPHPSSSVTKTSSVDWSREKNLERF